MNPNVADSFGRMARNQSPLKRAGRGPGQRPKVNTSGPSFGNSFGSSFSSNTGNNGFFGSASPLLPQTSINSPQIMVEEPQINLNGNKGKGSAPQLNSSSVSRSYNDIVNKNANVKARVKNVHNKEAAGERAFLVRELINNNNNKVPRNLPKPNISIATSSTTPKRLLGDRPAFFTNKFKERIGAIDWLGRTNRQSKSKQSLDLPRQPYRIQLNESAIKRARANLLKNGLKFTYNSERNGRIAAANNNNLDTKTFASSLSNGNGTLLNTELNENNGYTTGNGSLDSKNNLTEKLTNEELNKIKNLLKDSGFIKNKTTLNVLKNKNINNLNSIRKILDKSNPSNMARLFNLIMK